MTKAPVVSCYVITLCVIIVSADILKGGSW